MSIEARRLKKERRLDQLEHDYLMLLNAALQQCRAGRWGLFGQNDHTLKLDSPAETLIAMAESIRHLRDELGNAQSFEPHRRFMHYRSFRGANVPGEPKLAEARSHELSKLSTE